MLIDCSDCQMQHTSHCRDCIVTALIEPGSECDAVVIDADEERALREMARQGLVPEIRMRRRPHSA
ncbi:MAG TPA: hypothetical protein VNE62_06655 [Actinomycetota bacterium]|nr:hypothetical protein [Actinomycetota bacterium]